MGCSVTVDKLKIGNDLPEDLSSQYSQPNSKLPESKEFVKFVSWVCQANLEMSCFQILDSMGLPRSYL